MKIKYLKDTHDSEAGDVKEVQDLPAKVLIALGFAELESGKAVEVVEVPMLLNLNGTPVIDDFGTMVLLPQTPEKQEIPAGKPKRANNRKKGA